MRLPLSTKLHKYYLVVVCLPLIVFLAWPVPKQRLKGFGSLSIVSKEGTPLRLFRDSAFGSYSEWNDLKYYPAHLITAVLTAEDKRFFTHIGFDYIAFSRAIIQNLFALRIVSGGSTITQQLCRLNYHDTLPKNPYMRKLFEIALAIRLNLHYSKREILEAYLNRVPVKFNRTGLSAGSRIVFGKSPEHLVEEESIALAVLIRQSNVSEKLFFRRYRDLEKKLSVKKHIDKKYLRKIYKTISENKDDNQNSEIFSAYKAPHFIDWLRSYAMKNSGVIHTEISSELQSNLSEILNNELDVLGENYATNASIVVLEKIDGELALRALIGSRNFQSSEAGQVNGATSIRTAGSTLKPFIYAQAMENFSITPYTLIDDRDISLATDVEGETYRPRNYDLNYWGKLTIREALATSRNIPAITLLKKNGEDNFYRLLKKLKIDHMKQSPSYFGAGMALGTIGVSLLELTHAYSVFPSEGKLLPLVLGVDETGEKIVYGEYNEIFSQQTAIQITHILADNEMRRKAFGHLSFLDFPFEVAAKTGTSKDYRDSWTIGYTSKYIVGVWVGNFSGKAMKDISGVFGAGRIFQQIIRILHKDQRHRFKYPPQWKTEKICRHTSKIAQEYCPTQIELVRRDNKIEHCDKKHSEFSNTENSVEITENFILSPIEKEVYIFDPHTPKAVQRIPIKILYQPNIKLSYQINSGKKIAVKSEVNTTVAMEEGKHSLKVFNNNEEIQRVHFTIE